MSDFPYTLVDFGEGEKLEQFGRYLIIRPESRAVGRKSLRNSEWNDQAHARFILQKNMLGYWKMREQVPESIEFSFKMEDRIFNTPLVISQNKHIGIYPEQMQNWEKIKRIVKAVKEPRMLNLFGYTGVASIIAAAFGANVVHVEALRQINDLGKQYAENSGVSNIRWIADDAHGFMLKEIRRISSYDLILMDPPSFGRSPKGKIWKLTDHLPELVDHSVTLLKQRRGSAILNVYDNKADRNYLLDIFKKHTKTLSEFSVRELNVEDRFGKFLKTGLVVYYRVKG